MEKAVCYSRVFMGGGQMLTSLGPLFDDADGYLFQFLAGDGIVLREFPTLAARAYAGCRRRWI